MEGAKAGETSIWKIRLQLMKPITWIPLIWGVVCGAASWPVSLDPGKCADFRCLHVALRALADRLYPNPE
jgi:4-hydroxybenzoate polyprenyltransferase